MCALSVVGWKCHRHRASRLTPSCLPAVLNTLRQLSTTTSILTDPSQLPEQAAQAVTRIGQRSGES